MVVRHLLDGEVELLACHEIERRTGLQALLGLDHHLGADEADLEIRLQVAQHADRADVGVERRRRGMHDDEVVVLHLRRDIVPLQAMGRGIDELGVLDQCGRLRQPGRIPEGLHLTLHLVAGTGAAVVAVEGRSLKKKRAHHDPAMSGDVMVPSGLSAKRWPRQSIEPGQKLRRKTRKAA